MKRKRSNCGERVRSPAVRSRMRGARAFDSGVGDGVQSRRGSRMGRSRLAWAGSAVAPWGIALGLPHVDHSAGRKKARNPSGTDGLVARGARADRPSSVREALLSSTFGTRARSFDARGRRNFLSWRGGLTLGAPSKRWPRLPRQNRTERRRQTGQGEFPRDRSHRARAGPFILVLRPGLNAHLATADPVWRGWGGEQARGLARPDGNRRRRGRRGEPAAARNSTTARRRACRWRWR